MFSFLRKKALWKKAAFAGLILLALGFTLASCSSDSSDDLPGEARITTYTQNTAQGKVDIIISNRGIDASARAAHARTVEDGDNYVIKLNDVEVSRGIVRKDGIYLTFVPSGGGETFSGSFNGGMLKIISLPLPAGGTLNVEATAPGTSGGGAGGGGGGGGKPVTSNPGDTVNKTVPTDLIGTWESAYGEEFTITATTFDSSYGGSTTYAGTIENVRITGTSGYITIRYTTAAYYSEGVGKYYVIHIKNLAATATPPTVDISGAYKGGDPDLDGGNTGGKATRAEAETAFTVENGYYGNYSSCEKQAAPGPTTYPNKLEGTWKAATTDEFRITNQTITYLFGGTQFWRANIVNVRDEEEGPATGYLTFEYTSHDDPSLVGMFAVLYWENLTSGASAKADIIAVYSSSYFGDDGAATQALAESTWDITHGDLDPSDAEEFDKQP